MNVIHLTSAHSRYDTRIFLKQCRSLVRNGFNVSLIVADGKGDEVCDGVSIVDVGFEKNRLRRMMLSSKRVLKKALSLDADICHLHDPELIPAGLSLIRAGKKVIFDAHEDVPLQLLNKPYLNYPVRWMLARIYGIFESKICPRFDAIITATPTIRNKYQSININVIDINNFPLLDEFDFAGNDWSQKKRQICYIGGLSAIRGLKECVMALSFIKSDMRLAIGGKFLETGFEKEVKSLPGWNQTDELGFLNRQAVKDLLAESIAGLVTLYPVNNYLDSLPVKMFEYMSAGIPVIASDFPLWREIIEKNKCGICLNPKDPQAIAAAMDYLATNPEMAMQMGKNGRKTVERIYNWNQEEPKLILLYRKLFNLDTGSGINN